MKKYLSSLNPEIRDYLTILEPNFPKWLLDYLDTPAMRRLSGISINCGTDYSGCFNIKYWYSNLEHSLGVALIVWHFTHDRKQTLAGLFHDIATPAFKHCIDFMNGDSERQESTESRTRDIIKNSPEIMRLLRRDGIALDEVSDYKLYPIADNETPRLSADRFEYTFSSGLVFRPVWTLDAIRVIYNDITVLKNEEGIDELGFKTQSVCERYIRTASKLWPSWVSEADRTSMQFLADICRSMSLAGHLTTDDLYEHSEQEIIDRILNCEDTYLADSFRQFAKANLVTAHGARVPNLYSTKVKSKTRYVDPLVSTPDGAQRISKLSPRTKSRIANYLALPKGGYWTTFDFDFQPYTAAKRPKNSSNFIAVFDSGVGGLSVLSALKTALPDETFRYFADTEHAPYGEKSATTVQKLVEKQVDSFIKDGAKAVVLACNTATSVAAAALRKKYPDVPIIGMEPALKPAVESKKHPKVLILATPLTIQEQKFQQLAERYQDSAEIIPVPCAGLAEAVEQAFATAGYQGSTPSTTDLAQILDRIQSNSAIHDLLQKLIGPYAGQVDAVVLGCTHYVHLSPLITAILGKNVAIFDGVDGTVREVTRRLEEHRQNKPANSRA